MINGHWSYIEVAVTEMVKEELENLAIILSLELFVVLKQSHPFQSVQDTKHFSVVLPIPNKQMELHRDSDQPSLIKLTII